MAAVLEKQCYDYIFLCSNCICQSKWHFSSDFFGEFVFKNENIKFLGGFVRGVNRNELDQTKNV
jgi:hypothetical protein